MEQRIVELSHVIREGMVTYPGFPGPQIGTYMSREASRERYAAGTEFFIGTVSMIANTGTYLDAPFHRYPEGDDLASIAAARLLGAEGVVVRRPDGGAIDADALADVDLAGRAVLFHTGWDLRFGTPEYGTDHPYLTADAATRLVDGGAAVVGIDSVNIDATTGDARPVHSTLLAAGIPIIEHMTGLEQLPDNGFEVTALPPRFEGLGSFPVRVVAKLRG
jgi:kynurenine formamidase